MIVAGVSITETIHRSAESANQDQNARNVHADLALHSPKIDT